MGVDTSRAAQRGLHDGLRRFAEAVLELAQEDVPVGDPRVDPNPSVSLRESGHIEWLTQLALQIVFSTDYATKIHESLYLEHPRGGTHHFLENALKAMLSRLDEFVADAVEAEMEFASGAVFRPGGTPETFGRRVT